MMNLYEAIARRQSIRRYRWDEVPEKLRGQVLSYFDKTSRLNDRIQMEVEILDNTKKQALVHGLWKAEAPYYLVIYSETTEGFERNAGYVMEQLILYLTVKGLGSCYLGASRPRQLVKNGKKFVMLAAFGYPEGKLYRESALAKRHSLNELCMFKEEAGEQLKTILKAARLAPSAMNLQPWRFIVYSDRIYVFMQKNKMPFPVSNAMRDFDIGIMLSHIMLAAEELWMELQTETEEPFASKSYKNGEYVATLSLH